MKKEREYKYKYVKIYNDKSLLLNNLNKGWEIIDSEIIYDNNIMVSRYNEFGKKPYNLYLLRKEKKNKLLK